MTTSKGRPSIVFLHPDLGIGGAERLVVDAAVGLQRTGYKVTVFTSHCDPAHCFDEARDGTLDVRVRGNSIVPPNILGRFAILCAILRQIHLVLLITFSGELKTLRPDVFFVDQLSACIPLLRMFQPRARIMFYCHFPDQLLATRRGWVKSLYRIPFDWLETWTTGAADGLLVNSKFTRDVFGQTFPGLKDRNPGVVYPCVDTEPAVDTDEALGDDDQLWGGKKVILSINRFERKKGVERAVQAFAGLDNSRREGARLVIAGGYDPRVHENVVYQRQLLDLAELHGLRCATTKTIISALSIPTDVDVLFLLSVPASLKATLLHHARLLVYTPEDEHFGIVPLEAMLARTPVLASNSGGPLETVKEGVTGWLRPVSDVPAWTAVMHEVLNQRDVTELQRMGEQGRLLVQEEFSEGQMAKRLHDEIQQMLRQPRRRLLSAPEAFGVVVGVGAVGLLIALAAAWFVQRR
ncbi:MAG: Alpha-1,3-mannosyltransferase-like protein [Caeruleum heppii]|nr:MAG: Alpha-1,3-mannosyltransferase-like protein [Caeruleum heppii]